MAVTSMNPVKQLPVKPSMRLSKIIGYSLLYLFLVVLALIFIFPFYSMIVGSLMPSSELFRSYPVLWPPSGPSLTAVVANCIAGRT